jgi:cytochrome c peroxidase
MARVIEKAAAGPKLKPHEMAALAEELIEQALNGAGLTDAQRRELFRKAFNCRVLARRKAQRWARLH